MHYLEAGPETPEDRRQPPGSLEQAATPDSGGGRRTGLKQPERSPQELGRCIHRLASVLSVGIDLLPPA